MSDYFKNLQNEKTPVQNNNESSNNYWNDLQKEQNEIEQKRLENRQKYGVDISDDEYSYYNNLIADSPNPDEEAHKIGTAILFSNELGITRDEAYANLDEYKKSFWDEKQTTSYRNFFQVASDSLKMGNNNVRMGMLGMELMAAQKDGNTEREKALLEEYKALKADNETRYDNAPRTWATRCIKDGMQSLPYSLAAGGAAMFGSFMLPGVGTALSFGMSSTLMSGQEYLDALEEGVRPEIARKKALISGTLQGAVEAALDPIVGAAGGTMAKVAGKTVIAKPSEALIEKLTTSLQRKFHFGKAGKIALNALFEYLKSFPSEGAEEFIQQEIGERIQNKVYSEENQAREEDRKVMLENAVNLIGDAVKEDLKKTIEEEYPDLKLNDEEKILKDSIEAFKGGVRGAIVLGLIPGAAKGIATEIDYLRVKQLATEVESETMFNNIVENTKAGQNVKKEFTEKQQESLWHDVWQAAQQEREKALNTKAKEVSEVNPANEGYEEAEVDPETGEIIAKAPYRTESGALDTQNIKTGDNTYSFRVGDTSKSNKNLYGNIEYTKDEANNTITINSFEMAEQREGLRNEVFDDFAKENAGSNIVWDNVIGDRAKAAKEALIAANPSGKENGLNYYSDRTAIDNAKTIKEVSGKIKEIFTSHNKNISDEELTHFTAFTQMAYNSLESKELEALKAAGINSYSDFMNTIHWGNEEELAADLARKNETNADKVQGLTYQANLQQIAQGVKAIIYVGKNGDFSTLVHEFTHFLRGVYTDEAIADVAEALGVQKENGKYKWTTKDEENLAYNFEQYLYGKFTPQNNAVKNFFDSIAKFMTGAINHMKNFIKLTPQIIEAYDSLLKGDDSILKNAETAVKEMEEGRKAKAEADQQRQNFERRQEEAKEAKYAGKKPSARMSYETLLDFPDSLEKYRALEKKLLKLQVHGPLFFKAQEEWKRLYDIYGDDYARFFDTVGNTSNETLQAEDQAIKDDFPLNEAEAAEAEETVQKEQQIVDDVKVNMNNSALSGAVKESIANVITNPDISLEEKQNIADETAIDAMKEDEGLFQLIGLESVKRAARNEYTRGLLENAAKAALMDQTGSEFKRTHTDYSKEQQQAAIKAATGWEVIDGELKYETDDSIDMIHGKHALDELLTKKPSEIAYLSTNKKLIMEDYLQADELFNLFPMLKNARIEFLNDDNIASPAGMITPEGIEINIAKLDLSDMHSEYGVLGQIVRQLQNLIFTIENSNRKDLDKLDYAALYRRLYKKASELALTKSFNEEVLSKIPELAENKLESYSRRAAKRLLLNRDGRKSTFTSTQDITDFYANRTYGRQALNQILGELGATELDRYEETVVREDNKTIADEMEKAGKNAREIRLATGWERGADNLWRYEIPDGKIKKLDYHVLLTNKDSVKLLHLKDLYDAPELYKAYPELKDLYIRFFKNEGTLGYFRPDANFINLDPSYFEDWKEGVERIVEEDEDGNVLSDESIDHTQNLMQTLIHEIQHWIQHKEGFATGGSGDWVKSRVIDNALDQLNATWKADNNFKEATRKAAIIDYLLLSRKLSDNPEHFTKTGYYQEYGSVFGLPKNKEERIATLNDMIDKWRTDMAVTLETADGSLAALEDYTDEELKDLLKKEQRNKNKYAEDHYSHVLKAEELETLRNTSPSEFYKRMSGEAESRNVESRMLLSAETRLKTPLTETMDVSPKDQIIFFETANAYSESEGRSPLYQIDENQVNSAVSIINNPKKYSAAECERITKNMQDHKNTPYYNLLVYSINIRNDMQKVMAGEKIPETSQIARFTNIIKFLEKGEQGLYDYLESESSILSTPDKCVNAVSSSIINCNPSKACAKFCYVANGTGTYANSILKSEMVNEAIERDPKRAAKIAADQYLRTLEGKKNYELRILDRGDLSEKWIPFIQAMNERGVRIQIFSKRPEFLAKIDKNVNICLLSIDNTNAELAEQYPELPIALVYQGEKDLPLVEKYKDRFLKINGVILPVKTRNDTKVGKYALVKALPIWAKRGYTCPIDAEWKKIGLNTSGEGWNCTKCDKVGWGCFINNGAKGRPKLSGSIIESTVGEINEYNRKVEELVRQSFPGATAEQIRQFITSYAAINNSQFGNLDTTGNGNRTAGSNEQVQRSTDIQTDSSGVLSVEERTALQQTLSDEEETTLPEYPILSDKDIKRLFLDDEFMEEHDRKYDAVMQAYQDIIDDPNFIAMHIYEGGDFKQEKYIHKNSRGTGGKWQMSLFDKLGPVGHVDFDTITEANRSWPVPTNPQKVAVVYDDEKRYDDPYYDALDNNDYEKAAAIVKEYAAKKGYTGPVDTEVTDNTDILIPLTKRFNKKNKWYTQADFDAIGREYSLFQKVDDPEELQWLNEQPTIKAYRTVQLQNGGLYPPMAGKIKKNGKLEWQKPVIINEWERSEEHPELIDKNGNFTLNKGNGKSIPGVVYAPYFHSSQNMLNDQFNEAQDRPELVVVEVEIPLSEINGENPYTAPGSKRSVGPHEWPSGILRNQMAGKRIVYLSRWDKVVRIVPNEEVVANIDSMLREINTDRSTPLPTNVFTPQVKEGLEKLGYTFIPTDNHGHILEGENKGKTYSSIYGKEARKPLHQEIDKQEVYAENIERQVADRNPLYQTAYHGTTADFDRFDTEKYGLTGEGSMSFGYGVYVTASEEIARDYAERQFNMKYGTTDRKYFLDQERKNLEKLQNDIKQYESKESYNEETERIKKDLQEETSQWYRKVLTMALNKRNEEDRLENLNNIQKSIDESKEKIKGYEEELEKINNEKDTAHRRLYTIDIPDRGFIKWEKTVPKAKRERIVSKLYDRLIKTDYKGAERELHYELQPMIDNSLTGKELYQDIWTYLGSDKEASAFLYKNGVYGIEYPAGTNFGTPDGIEATNYVIFNDDDAKITRTALWQTRDELYNDARAFDTWQEFMDDYTTSFDPRSFDDPDFHSQVPSDADAQFYQSVWEMAHAMQPDESFNSNEVVQQQETEDGTAKDLDDLFVKKMTTDPNMLNDFIKEAARIHDIDFGSQDYVNPADQEEAEQWQILESKQDYINTQLTHGSWISNGQRLLNGEELTAQQRKILTSLIKAAPRDYREIYSNIMDNETYRVSNKDSVIPGLDKKARKYNLVAPNETVERMSPEKRRQLTNQITDREMAAKIRNGSLKLDDELTGYIKRLNSTINEQQKSLDKMQEEIQGQYDTINTWEARRLLDLNEQLQEAKKAYDDASTDVKRKIEAGLKITDKYQNHLRNMKGSYEDIFRRFEDLKNAITVSEEVKQLLDKQEKVQNIKNDLNAKKNEKKAAEEVKKMRLQLVKRTMRRVPFDRVAYDEAKTVIAIQRMLEPNLIGGVNRWIGTSTPVLRNVISQIITDDDFRTKFIKYMKKTAASSQQAATLIKNLENLKTLEDFEKWTDQEKKYAAKKLPKEDWVRDLDLYALAKEREESIDINVEMQEEEIEEPLKDENGNIMYKPFYEKDGKHKVADPFSKDRIVTDMKNNPILDENGNLQYRPVYNSKGEIVDGANPIPYTVTKYVQSPVDKDIEKLVKNAVGADLYDKIINKPFASWSTVDLENLAQKVNDLYVAGRDRLAAIKQLRRESQEELREAIEGAVKNTGIVINPDDPEDVKKKKQEKINKILGIDNAIKGTQNLKKETKINRLLHGYADANIRRVARILDNYSEGTNTDLLYWREDECYNNKQRSLRKRVEKINKVMEDNNISLNDLYKEIEVDGRKYTVDELLYFLAADEDHVDDPQKLADKKTGLEANDDLAATSRNALLYGNMLSDSESLELKEYFEKEDKEMADRLKSGKLTTDERNALILNELIKNPGSKDFMGICKRRYKAVLDAAGAYEKEHPELKALRAVIAEDYAEQYDRMNETSILEFNTPVNRVKCYVPLYRLENNGATNENQVKEDLLATMGSDSTRSWVNKGMTQRRVTINPIAQKPIKTGLYKTWTESSERTEHFIAYSGYVRDLNAVYKSRDANYVRQYLENRYGKGMLNYIDEYISEVANPNANKVRNAADELVRTLRGKTAPAYLSWKASSILKQAATSPWPYMQFINPVSYIASCFKCMKPGTMDAIKSKSVFMANRRFDPMADLTDEMADKARNKFDSIMAKTSQIGMSGLELIDWVAVAPGWLACYEKKYNELNSNNNAKYQAIKRQLEEDRAFNADNYKSNEEIEKLAEQTLKDAIEYEAVRYADDCVRLCQPSNRNVDISPLFKNSSEAWKAYLQFQTSLNVIWQNIRYDIPYAVRQKQFRQVVGMILGYTFAGIAMNFLISGAGNDEDDDDKKKGQAARDLIYYSTTQFTDSIPLIGSYVTAADQRMITGKGGYTTSGTDMTPMLTKFINVGTNAVKGMTYDDEEKAKEAWIKACTNFGEGVGMYLGLPTQGVKEALKIAGVGDNDGKAGLHLENVYGSLEPVANKVYGDK